MAGKQGKSKKIKHSCPKLPDSFVKWLSPSFDTGDSFSIAKRKWIEWVKKLQTLRPTPRKTSNVPIIPKKGDQK